MDLASAVIGIASFGVQVSSAHYKFSDSARNAETDIVGLAQNIELTSNVLQSVGQILQRDDIAEIPNLATKTAIEKTLKGCDLFSKSSCIKFRRRENSMMMDRMVPSALMPNSCGHFKRTEWISTRGSWSI
ncbi:hypothetical protein BDV97DRAFT_40546 [Delphinella strobiligena]|nr:hypothetical protein BDV97DRAFT_40546 [Delphinella strobiligena]